MGVRTLEEGETLNWKQLLWDLFRLAFWAAVLVVGAICGTLELLWNSYKIYKVPSYLRNRYFVSGKSPQGSFLN